MKQVEPSRLCKNGIQDIKIAQFSARYANLLAGEFVWSGVIDVGLGAVRLVDVGLGAVRLVDVGLGATRLVDVGLGAARLVDVGLGADRLVDVGLGAARLVVVELLKQVVSGVAGVFLFMTLASEACVFST